MEEGRDEKLLFFLLGRMFNSTVLCTSMHLLECIFYVHVCTLVRNL